ncbi:MAG: pyrimidine dimer DNA glycosylase/endonuclease V [Proteobacteria bacterium]|nr:pyrimidine dimer DNA glycosylase/endonuclease V [Pseudomonadota bacterium]MBU1639281.1 pyrimidine dimer DNA glycosylase/endonuclease V [Pseudomonadota bacterium]
MRLWSIHPAYLDAKGLVALWREGLLAQKVLHGNTQGYKNHPQLSRFKNADNPLSAIAEYLRCIHAEAAKRDYHFNNDKIVSQETSPKIPVTSGQLAYEFQHLLAKLKKRQPDLYQQLKTVARIKVHPLFTEVDGKVEYWEKI